MSQDMSFDQDTPSIGLIPWDDSSAILILRKHQADARTCGSNPILRIANAMNKNPKFYIPYDVLLMFEIR